MVAFHASRQCLAFPTSFDRSRDRRAWCGGLSLAQRGAVSTHGCSSLSVDQAAARGGLAEMIGTIRSRVGFFFRPFRNNGRPAYLNTPPMTEAKKIAAAAKSNPATIFFSEQRRVEQPACQVDGADRIWRTAISTTRRRWKRTVYNTCVYAGSRKYQRSAGSTSRAPAGAVAASVPGCRH
jgi:hypothetical protein